MTEFLTPARKLKQCTHQSIELVDVFSTIALSSDPQGHRRLRFSFSSSLVKEQCLRRQVALKRQTRTSRRPEPGFCKPPRPRSSRRSKPPQQPAVDEAFLHNQPNNVNTKIKKLLGFFSGRFGSTSIRGVLHRSQKSIFSAFTILRERLSCS